MEDKYKIEVENKWGHTEIYKEYKNQLLVLVYEKRVNFFTHLYQNQKLTFALNKI